MPYLGNTPTTQSFISGTDYFNGTGAQTAFTLSRTVASVNDIQAVVNNVVQVPNDAYTISGTTITFTSAPSSGTQNVYVRYLSTTTQAITPSQNTVSWSTLDSNVQGDLGISFKNRIINGAMQIDQRNAGSAVTTSGSYPVDRFAIAHSGNPTFSLQQISDAPSGFVNSIRFTTTNATGAYDFSLITQTIEGTNISDLAWGSANAKTVTLSFWTKSSLTGTFGGALNNGDSTRLYPFTYTISAANTWEYKTVTITGDTSGTWLTTTGRGINVRWQMAATSTYTGTNNVWQTVSGKYAASGCVQILETLNATWQLTGVQLEVGTQATTFTTAGGSYGAELALCQRYFFPITLPRDTNECYPAIVYSSTTILIQALPVTIAMRATPSITTTIGTATISFYRYDGTLASTQTPNAFSVSARSTNNCYWFELQWTGASSWGSSRNFGAIGLGSGSSSTMNLSAEL
jgi:hypothetical protein